MYLFLVNLTEFQKEIIGMESLLKYIFNCF